MVEVLNLVFVALHSLGISLLQVYKLNGVKLLFVIQHLIHLYSSSGVTSS